MSQMGTPLSDFSRQRIRRRFEKALANAEKEAGASFPLLLGREERTTGSWIISGNPARPDQKVGRVAAAGLKECDEAVGIACEAQRVWGKTPVEERIGCLRRAARLLRGQRDWFAALEVLEVGKPWREADADVAEAIDYLLYYARQMGKLSSGRTLPRLPGEDNRYIYLPRGVATVIAPWNFPLAILTGMASAALVAGNTTILKPAEQSSLIAYHLACLLHRAGVPREVLQFLPGDGEEVGRRLVEHPEVALILFTGSRAVGLEILQSATRVPAGQRFVKHVVAEMGGKNAIIVDDDADLDAAIKGMVTSAFGYAGQKCSAASRLLIHQAVFDRVSQRLISTTGDLVLCDPRDPRCQVGPVIDRDAFARLGAEIEQAKKEATLYFQYPRDRLPKDGYFVGPTLFGDVHPSSRLAREELFGPVVSLFRVKNFLEALEIANSTDYALTGGVYSRSPAHLRQAAAEFEVGNLYLNRPITGAVVGRQPFGGYRLSGLGTKAGGPDYLLQLLNPRVITENTARHGMPLD